MRFKVMNEGKGVTLSDLIQEDSWARADPRFRWKDIEQFAMGEDGTLYLLDEWGRWEYAPNEYSAVMNDAGKKQEPASADRPRIWMFLIEKGPNDDGLGEWYIRELDDERTVVWRTKTYAEADNFCRGWLKCAKEGGWQ